MRRLLTIPCAGETIAATIDDAPGRTGLLIVSGGNELRIGAHRGMALLAGSVAGAGFPVMRFDRRGVGDATGDNRGFLDSAADIAAAAAAFRAETGVTRIIGFGNCDAATALALFHARAGIDALVLANPWVVEPVGDLPPPAAIRAHYAARLRSPGQWWRLVRGGVDLGRVVHGMTVVLGRRGGPGPLALRMADALDASVPARILLATGDNTAIAFADAWRHRRYGALRKRVPLYPFDTASHSFAGDAEATWLRGRILDTLQAMRD